jgi:hypothetical protein
VIITVSFRDQSLQPAKFDASDWWTHPGGFIVIVHKGDKTVIPRDVILCVKVTKPVEGKEEKP